MSEFKVGDRVKLTFNNDFGTIVDEEEDCFGKHRQYKVLLDGDSDAVYYSKLSLELVDVNNKTQDQQKIEELEQRIEKLEKCVLGEQNSLEKCENVSSMSKNGLLTEDERVILRNLDKGYIYIARDGLGNLIVFKEHPFRGECSWLTEILQNHDFLQVFNHLFKFIKYEDEPYNIEELLKGECGNE